MIRVAAIFASAALAFFLPGPAVAQPEADKSALFASEALRLCVDTRAAAPAVRQQAALENWTKVDANTLPYQSRVTMGDQKLRRNVTYHPADAWTVDKDGLALFVAVYDIAERPKVKHCEIMAWDLDSTAVDRALRSDRRVKGGHAETGIASRRYWVKGTYFRYGAGAVGDRTLHLLTAM